MKRSITRAAAVFVLFSLLTLPVSAELALIPGGQVVGIALEDGSVTVAAFDDQLGGAAQQAGLQTGDRITHIDGQKVDDAADVQRLVERSDGTVDLQLERKGKTLSLRLSPCVTADGPRLGVYLKQGVTGIGTVTFVDPQTGAFGALGHGVNGSDGKPVTMRAGRIYAAAVSSVEKGAVGAPGQLSGTVTDESLLGTIEKNTVQGIFGEYGAPQSGDTVPVAQPQDIKTGPAVIRSTVEGDHVQEYSVEILKIYPGDRQTGRNMLLKVTDPDLLETTGGIVQGMSGSPIIQDGKLVGAVTHVLVNDPTMGYGIFIENMLDAAA